MEERRTQLITLVLVFLIAFLLGFGVHAFLVPVSAGSTVLKTIFSPDAETEFSSLILQAQKSIDVEIYTFSSEEIAEQLIAAKNRGVKVRVIMEKRIQSETNEKTFEKLQKAGIEVKWASKEYKLTHSKFMILDGTFVVVGSHNFSKNALNSNREASVLITGEKVKDFILVFEEDWILADLF